MAQITPELIIERHKKYPNDTAKLIESYAFQQYRKAVNDAINHSSLVKIPENRISMLIFSDSAFESWKDLLLSNWHLNDLLNTIKRLSSSPTHK